MNKLVSVAVIALSITACVTEEMSSQDDLAETTQASTWVPQDIMEFDKKPLFASWKNFCEALEGEFSFTDPQGCTTTRTYSNCRRGVQDGVCICDVSVRETGNCN